MKTKNIMALAGLLAITFSCSDSFLETTPIGVASDVSFSNEKGIDGLLTGAYAYIDGTNGWAHYWQGAVSNWVWGSVASDDAYKGLNGWSAQIDEVEQYSVIVDNSWVASKWIANYDGVSRSNDVLKVLATTEDIDEKIAIQFEAEAKFLRAWFHFELKRVFNNIPFITEDPEVDPATVKNTIDAWPMIEADLEFAANNLPKTQSQVGRPTKYAAEAVLARVHLFQSDWSAAATLLDDIILNGGYDLMESYHDNYNIPNNNNKESIFEIQYVVNDGASGSANGGLGDNLSYPHGSDIGTCCGVHYGSQDLVNAFKVDDNGLPLFDTFNDSNFKNDYGIVSSDFFAQDTTTLIDPRLDWTVGRRGVPYLDWDINRGTDWLRDPIPAGPYLAKKGMFYQSERGTLSTTTGWSTGVNANNYRAYRYAHVLLWRAECAVELNDLETARTYVNMIRARAMNEVVMGRCRTFEQPTTAYGYSVVDYDLPAANYLVEEYPSFPSQEYARNAVHWELRLEFGMEGHRFFDLIRWGEAEQVLNEYIANDKEFRTYYTNAVFNSGKDEYQPIPLNQIDLQGSDILQQNPGYN
jgi:hypothetical protein